ncbi:lipopolysaccharide biosynthesis protein [Clostridium sp. Marseille-P299]|uniref:lipopolysaccharide biosynthesis protein n=1 Tax=Clostridium sp. Marseille-P299 TaxID=1805477 RepID=UPI000836D80A|nr:oligosaccharide flippase family protein [Clostridium sp. Marseille-P299]
MVTNILKVLFSNGLITLVGLVNSIIFPFILSINGYADYQEFLLYVSYIFICQLGLSSGLFINYGGKKYKEIDKSQYKSEILLLLFILTMFTIVGMILYVFIMNKMFLAVVLSILPIGIIGTYKALFQAWDQFTDYAIYNAVSTVAFTVVLLVSFLVFKRVESNMIITSYLVIQYVITCNLLIKYYSDTKGFRTKKLWSKKNKRTMQSGFLLLIGNYINVLLHAIDKQFVNTIYSRHSFAMYSFAMSTQGIMTVLITALANPIYPRLARGDIEKDLLNRLKELLFMLGAMSGCAYFVVAFLVKTFIGKYTDSLQIVSVFFAAFPAIAVINVLYINLYKITRQFKKYIATLIGILIVAFVMNSISVALNSHTVGISVATMCVYYVWLIYSQRDFEEIKLQIRDYAYLLLFLITYFICVKLLNSIVGLVCYTVIIILLDIIFYKDNVLYFVQILTSKLRKRNELQRYVS